MTGKNLIDEAGVNIHSANSTLKQILNALVPLFRFINLFVIISLLTIFFVDQALLVNHFITPAERIIDKSIVMALIAATAAETSVIILASIKRLK